jgi:hypothetical protein
MKQLWQKVLVMLKCWSMLVPLRLMDGFKAATTNLERLAARPRMISFGQVVEDAALDIRSAT